MDQCPNVTPETVDALKNVVRECGRLGLFPAEVVDDFSNKPAGEIVPLAGAVAVFLERSFLVTGSERNNSPEEMLETGEYAFDALERMRLRALSETASKELPTRGARTFIKLALGITHDQLKPLESIQVRQVQIVAFSEKLLADYNRFHVPDLPYARRTARELRLYLAGKSDVQIKHEVDARTDKSISQFRVRMRRTLQDNYANGVLDIRRDFLRYLTPAQQEQLTAELPDIFDLADQETARSE